MAKEINIKEVVTDMIVVYLKNTYKKSSINLDPAIISKSLNDYEEQDLFDKVFYGFEDFMSDLFNNKWYDIASNNCKVNFGVFTDFMNTTKIQKVLVKHNLSWIDCFLSAVNGDKDICDSIYGEINKSNEAVDEAKQYRALRVQENAIEIAMNCYKEIYDKTDLPRDIIIGKIQDWAEEAEKEWEKPSCQANAYGEYLDFIEDFSTKKKEEFLEEWMNNDINVDGGLHTNKVSVNLNVEVTFDVDGEVDNEGIKNLARQMVADKMDCDLNTCYGNETYVDYNVSVANDIDKTYNADMARLLGQKYAKEYTLDGTSRCTYEEVAEAIETAINDFSNNNNNN